MTRVAVAIDAPQYAGMSSLLTYESERALVAEEKNLKIISKDHILFGASYDIHTSSIILPTNGRGAFEVSLIYVAPEKKSVSTACPKF